MQYKTIHGYIRTKIIFGNTYIHERLIQWQASPTIECIQTLPLALSLNKI